ncbi:MAG: helix-turn-helix transcriptional regulator [Candidatus Omnitrophica bacterium]|nr:helix-turn-helix transcriptional regulator [Candidatus Omnitrophota bacterium]
MYKYNEPSSERIRRIRLLRLKYLSDNNCKEGKFAKLVGISPEALKKIESGKEEIDSDTFSKLSEILGVSIEHLMHNRIMAEDQFIEPIIHSPQVGSLIHALRMQLMNKADKNNWRKYSLKSAAKDLGISSMELKRIEALSKSKYLSDNKFICKVADLFNIPVAYIKDLVDSSFPRGKEKKEATAKDSNYVSYFKDGEEIRGLVVLRNDLEKKDLETLKKRIELEINFLRSNSYLKQ